MLLKLTAFTLALAMILVGLAGCALIDKLTGKNTPQDDDNQPPAEPNKYAIVYDFEGLDYNQRAAEYIQTKIAEHMNLYTEIVDDSKATDLEYAIVVGETALPISKSLNADCEGFEFALKSEDGMIALEGDYFIIAAAAYYFSKTYIEGKTEISVPNQSIVRQPIVREAKNFIFLIGDGMGPMQTRLFEAYDVPTEGSTAYSDGEDIFYGYLFPAIGEARTNSLTGTTDSAAGGTALATGYKTYNTVVGRDKDGNDVTSLTELAASLGKATAVMSTESKTGATPASFSAHAADRDDKDDILASQRQLTATYGTIIDCAYNYYTANQLKIVEKHITDTLAKVDADTDGFFLMYEEAHIDKNCHNNLADEAFLALMRFNQAIGRFMEYAFYNPDTFVIITADHETGGLSITDGVCSFASDAHTPTNVPVFAYGYGAERFDGEEIENTQIPKTLAALMGVSSFGDPTAYGPLTE